MALDGVVVGRSWWRSEALRCFIVTSVDICRRRGMVATAGMSCGHRAMINSLGVEGVMCPRSGLLTRLRSCERIK